MLKGFETEEQKYFLNISIEKFPKIKKNLLKLITKAKSKVFDHF